MLKWNGLSLYKHHHMFVKWLWGVIWTGKMILKIKVIQKTKLLYILLWIVFFFTFLSIQLLFFYYIVWERLWVTSFYWLSLMGFFPDIFYINLLFCSWRYCHLEIIKFYLHLGLKCFSLPFDFVDKTFLFSKKKSPKLYTMSMKNIT